MTHSPPCRQAIAPVRDLRWRCSVGLSVCVALTACGSFGDRLQGELKAAGKAELQRAAADLQARAVAEGRAQLGELGASATRIATTAVASAVEHELRDRAEGGGGRGGTPSGVTYPQADRGQREWSPSARMSAAEAVGAHEMSELAALLLSRIAAHGVASAKLCELSVRRENAQEEIRRERAAERYSGVLREDVLHAAGHVMVQMDAELEKLRAAMARKLEEPPLPCAGGIRSISECMASGTPCAQEVEDIRRAFVHVEARLRGAFSDAGERELRAKMDSLRIRGAEYRAVNSQQMLRN